MNRAKLVTALIAGFASVGCATTPPIESCDPVGGATPLCGYQNPEDLALLPGGRHVLVSEYGTDRGPGRISLLDLETRSRRVLFEGGGAPAPGPWGAFDCEGPPTAAFSPHGIDLDRRPDGALQLLVVQHGGRESVEMFEVSESGGSWQLEWRGCAEPPAGHSLNDVVTLPEGGFLVTRILASDAGAFTLLGAGLFLMETGFVFSWTPDAGFHEVPGTGGVMPNGIELSPDGETIFLNQTLASEVTRIDRATGNVEARAEVAYPDNSTWASDGRLWVASLTGVRSGMSACTDLGAGSCPMAFAIVALDPETMETEILYEGGPGTPSGAGTVGLEVPGALLIGSFAGDRIVWVER
jgi:hypothetical protein